MSQTATPQAAPPPAAAAAAPAPAPAAAGASQPTPGLVDTPALLNRWQLIGMTTAILFGVFSALIQFGGWQSDGRAADDTEQLVRVQEIQSSLLRADALATNAFLVGGLEDPEQRKEYDDAIASVLRNITDAADAQPADREVLDDLNVEVVDYATAVAQARDNNRQGYPIGAEYLSGASDELRADAIPILKALVDANSDRAEESMNGQHPFWLLLLGIVVLVVLVWLNRELARHFHRRINKGIATAGVIILVVTVVTSFGALVRDNSNDDLREGDLSVATSQANARTAANDAKANESLALIKRGSGARFVTGWADSAKIVEKSLRRDTGDQWNAYVAVHEEIESLDAGGNWEKARDLATTTKDTGSSAPLTAFNDASEQIVKTSGDSVKDGLRSGRLLALILSILTLLLGVVAAVSVSRGIGERRKEFS